MDSEIAQQPPESSSVPSKTTSSKSSLYTVFKYVSIGMGIIGVGFLIALSAYLLGQKNNNQAKNITPAKTAQIATSTITPTPTLAATSITDTGIADQKRYTSPKLGISFVLSTKSSGEPVDVKEQGNKVYVYFSKNPYTQGQYVEVFPKTPADTIEQAIQKQFLANISAKDCFVKDAKPDSGANFPAGYEVKTLGYPVDPNSDLPAFAQVNKCPSAYAQINGLSYFLGDTKHPNTFLFFSIGQYGLQSEPNSQKTWQDTIEFLD